MLSPGDTVVVTQDSSDEIQLSFNGTNTDQNVFIQSVIDREKTVGEVSSAVTRLRGLYLAGGLINHFILFAALCIILRN